LSLHIAQLVMVQWCVVGAWHEQRTVRRSDDEVAAVTEGELRLTQLCLADRNPKSYCAWFHRQWIVAKYVVHVVS